MEIDNFSDRYSVTRSMLYSFRDNASFIDCVSALTNMVDSIEAYMACAECNISGVSQSYAMLSRNGYVLVDEALKLMNVYSLTSPVKVRPRLNIIEKRAHEVDSALTAVFDCYLKIRKDLYGL